MSDQGMNADQIERVFGALSRIETKVESTMDWMKQHVADDKLMANDIQTLKERAARQKGFIAAIGVMGSAIGAIAATAADFFRH
jgi:hypothetical protein